MVPSALVWDAKGLCKGLLSDAVGMTMIMILMGWERWEITALSKSTVHSEQTELLDKWHIIYHLGDIIHSLVKFKAGY